MDTPADLLNPRARTPRSRRPRDVDVPEMARTHETSEREAEIEATTRPNALGVLSLSAAVGLLTIAVGFSGARFGFAWTELLFWLGLLALVVPIAIRVALPRVARSERIGLAVLLTAGTYLVKVLHSPVTFAFGDEYAHLRTAVDILRTGELFHTNPLSLASPVYPGLEIATAAVADLTGLSAYGAGLLVIGTARVILGLALFLLVERLARSQRVAGIAAVVYAANPNFTFWSSQFAYESLALPLAIFLLWVMVRRASGGERTRQFTLLFALGSLALVMTHHLTSAALLAVLLGWVVAARLLTRFGGSVVRGPLRPALFVAVAGLAWVLAFARPTFDYLNPVIGGAFHDIAAFVAGQRAIKTFFRGDPSLVSPPWERVIAFGAVIVVALILGVAVAWFARDAGRARRFRAAPLAWVFAAGGLAYYPLQAVRAIQGGTEISNRAGDFLFLPIAFLVGLLFHAAWLRRRHGDARIAGFAVIATMIFVGGVIIGMPRWARMPGSYLVSGDTRAIQPESLDASAWVRRTFGPGNAIVADQTNALLMGSLGRQNVRHGESWVFFSPDIGRFELRSLRREHVRFVIVDQRMTTMLPVVGFYYEPGEPFSGRHTEPMLPEDLSKFGAVNAFTRVFDSGNIAIYELDAGGAATLPPSGQP